MDFASRSLAAPDHLFLVPCGYRPETIFLILFGFGDPGSQPFRQEDEHALFQKPGVGKNIQEDSKTFRASGPDHSRAPLVVSCLADPARHQFQRYRRAHGNTSESWMAGGIDAGEPPKAAPE